MSQHSRYDKLQDEFVDIQLASAHAFVCIVCAVRTRQWFFIEKAITHLAECISNHYLHHIVDADSMDELYPAEFRAERSQLQLL